LSHLSLYIFYLLTALLSSCFTPLTLLLPNLSLVPLFVTVIILFFASFFFALLSFIFRLGASRGPASAAATSLLLVALLGGGLHVDGRDLDRPVFRADLNFGALDVIFRQLTAADVDVDVRHLAILGLLHFARAEGEIKGMLASEDDLPIADYDSLTAEEIAKRLPELSQVDLTKVEVYERKSQARSTVLDRAATLRGDEPWAGYDEMTADEVVERLRDANDALVAKARDYERAHKNRTTVMRAVERELTHA